MLRELVREPTNRLKDASRGEVVLDVVAETSPRSPSSILEGEAGWRSSLSLPGASGSGPSRMVRILAPVLPEGDVTAFRGLVPLARSSCARVPSQAGVREVPGLPEVGRRADKIRDIRLNHQVNGESSTGSRVAPSTARTRRIASPSQRLERAAAVRSFVSFCMPCPPTN